MIEHRVVGTATEEGPAMTDWDLSGWETTAAFDLVRMIDARLPDVWTRHDDGSGMWRWERTSDEDGRHIVVVNALEDRVLVPVHGWPARVGPTVLAARWGDPFVSVTLPNMTDRTDLRKALAVVANVVPELADSADAYQQSVRSRP